MIRLATAAAILLTGGCGASGRFTASISEPATRSSAPREIVLPTNRCGDYFIATAMLDGRGPYRLKLDSGFPYTQLSARLADSLGLRGSLDSIRIGALLVRGRIPVNARNLDVIGYALGESIDGILGYTVLQDLVQTYDFPAGVVRLGTRAIDKGEPGVVPLSTGPRPFLRARIGSRTIDLLLDTGFSGGISLGELTNFSLRDTVRRIGSAARAEGVVYTEGARLEDDVVLDAFTIVQPVATSSARRNLLGQDVLRHFVVTIDRARGLARFEAADRGARAITLPSLHYTGLVLIPRADYHEVAEVLAETPAARAGLRARDRIVAVNGVPIASRGCARTEGDPARPRVLTVTRGDARFEVEVVPAVVFE